MLNQRLKELFQIPQLSQAMRLKPKNVIVEAKPRHYYFREQILPTKVGMLSLGCARNLVDAEVMLGYLKQAKFSISDQIEGADVAILNTCCFIREAEEESIDTILKAIQLKTQGRVQKIVVCGCLPQKHKLQLSRQLQEVDAFVGVDNLDKIARIVQRLLAGRKTVDKFSRPQFIYSHSSPRELLTASHFAYIKISDGCANRCSYCIIPKLRGAYRSRPIASIVQEGQKLLNQRGVSEINLIGQDTTMYGQDLYGRPKIVELLQKLSLPAKNKWLRLLYAHPAHFSPELIQLFKQTPAICKYIDLPIQHINDKILQKMRRQTSRRQIISLITALRKEISGLAIRTTLIVGFPGETQRQFAQLLDFIRDVKFERLGVFQYSREAQTPAYDFNRQIPQKVKQARYEQVLTLQQQISTQLNQKFLGQTLRVLIDQQDTQNKHQFLARSEYDAPEVDGCVYVRSQRKLKPGEFVQVKISDTLEYDLVGETQ